MQRNELAGPAGRDASPAPAAGRSRGTGWRNNTEFTMNGFAQAAEIDEEALKNARRGVPDGAFHR